MWDWWITFNTAGSPLLYTPGVFILIAIVIAIVWEIKDRMKGW